MEKLMVLDGNSLAYRAFHALPLLSTTTGLYTNAVLGFTNMLQKLVRQEKPDYLAVAFDIGKPFRHQDYEAYKAHRKPMPEELRPQFPLIKRVLRAFNMTTLEMAGYEADDLIGTMVRLAEKRGLEVLVVTGDRDMLQLVSGLTRTMITRKGISEMDCYAEEDVFKRYGLKPGQIPDLKGLIGDSSDNVPGVPGIGEKTAVKLLQQYGSIEACLSNRTQVSGKVAALLDQYADQAMLSKKLTQIVLDVPCEVDFEDLRLRRPNYEALFPVLQELEFKNLIRTLRNDLTLDDRVTTTAGEEPAGQDPGSICQAGGLLALMSRIRAAGRFALYSGASEAVAGNPGYTPGTRRAGSGGPGAASGRGGARRVGLAWGDSESAAITVPEDCAEKSEVLACLNDLLTSPSCEKWCHDAKAEMTAWRRYGIALEGITGDTKLASYLLHSATNPTIEEISMKHLNQVLVLPNEDENAVAQQALAVYRAWPVLQAELQEQGMGDLFYSLELPLSSVLAGMELAGVKLDVSQLDAMSSEFGRQLGRLTNEIYDLAGQSFNINSPRQLGVILFEKMKLPVVKKTKTGYSTDAAVLEELALYHEIAAKLLEYRQLLKLKSTYIDGLRALGLATGKVHTTYNQTITATGRLSSTEPNLQNIPIRMELGRKIRRAFVPSEPDWLIMAADYSQIELRILAHMSGDEKLLEAFSRGEDIHARTASEVFGVPQDEITPDLRHRAKGVNFGIVYGITDFGLARDIGVSREEAAVYIENYFRQYPDVRRFIQETIAAARDRGWVETLFKRRRYLPDLLSGNRQIRSFGERTAVNTPIQGTAADIIKLAMLRIDQSLRERGLLARMLLQVHDELVFEFPKQEQRELINLVREGMERAVELDVPLDVDIEIGPNWYDLRRVNGNA
ncbi:MAG: DNA polymerase I [Thermacetogeniaceae bacterium]|jgi:DNA polymerase-1